MNFRLYKVKFYNKAGGRAAKDFAPKYHYLTTAQDTADRVIGITTSGATMAKIYAGDSDKLLAYKLTPTSEWTVL